MTIGMQDSYVSQSQPSRPLVLEQSCPPALGVALGAVLSHGGKSPFTLSLNPLSSSPSCLCFLSSGHSSIPNPGSTYLSHCGPQPLNVDHSESHLSSLSCKTMVRSNSSPRAMACSTLSAEWALRFSDDSHCKTWLHLPFLCIPLHLVKKPLHRRFRVAH